MSGSDERFVVQARLLGCDESHSKNRRKSAHEFAMDVTLSDESSYVIFRTVKEIATLNTKLVAQFPVEAGYFNKKETVIPSCPLKNTIFGPSRMVREDKIFERLLNSYIKELPSMPASIVKSDIIKKFFQLRTSDMSEPGQDPKSSDKKKRRSEPIKMTADSSITGPMRLRSYYAVAAYKDSKTKFSFAEGSVLQVLKKDPSGWWMVDANGAIGWAPASYLVPVDEEDIAEETKENERLMCSMRVGARYISLSAYQASRDDEISFVSGAIVKLIKKYADGWWLVRYNGGEGFVPGSMFRKFDRRQGTAYVKNIRRKFHARKSTRIIPTLKPKWMSDSKDSAAASPATTNLVLYQCLTRYKGSDSSELSLNKGDIVKILDKKDHGWWYVEDMHGRGGWAPATYLGQVVDRSKDNTNPRLHAIVGSTREVRQAYTAQQKDELSVVSGDNVTVLSAPDDGWWVVCNMSSMEQGLIPSVCLSEVATSGPEEKGAEPTPELLESIKEYSEALESQEGEEGEEGEEEEDKVSDSCSYSSDIEDELMDGACYISTTTYHKQAQDELSIHEGQVVCVVDDSDSSMFYVMVDGKEGWVPSDVLKLTAGAGGWSMSSSMSSLNSRGRSHSHSVSPSPMPSRSPSPMDPSDFITGSGPLSHQHSTTSTPSQTYLRPIPRKRQMATRTKSLENVDQEVAAINQKLSSSTVKIHVEEEEELDEVEDIEQAACEAERVAQEAQRRAAELRERAQKVRRSITPVEGD